MKLNKLWEPDSQTAAPVFPPLRRVLLEVHTWHNLATSRCSSVVLWMAANWPRAVVAGVLGSKEGIYS